MSMGFRRGRGPAELFSRHMLGRMPDMALTRAMVREEAVRRALCCWVSELEPVLVFDVHGHFIGLTHAGQQQCCQIPIHVPVEGGKPI